MRFLTDGIKKSSQIVYIILVILPVYMQYNSIFFYPYFYDVIKVLRRSCLTQVFLI